MASPAQIRTWARQQQLRASDWESQLGSSPDAYRLRRELQAAMAVLARVAEAAEEAQATAAVVSLAERRSRHG